MMPLEQIRNAVAASVVAGTAGAALPAIAPTALPSSRLLGIYRNHYLVTLEDALAATFPTVRALVGPGFFAQVARRFIVAVPPTAPCLHEYGGRLPGFLTHLPEAQDLPYLPDVARLEWALNLAYHAADADSLPLPKLAAVTSGDFPKLRFRVHPACHLVSSRYPLTAIWRAAQQGADSDSVVDLDQGGETLLVMRDGDDVVFQRIDTGLHAFLHALMHRSTVTDAARAAQSESRGFDLSAALHALLDLEIFVDCTVTQNPHEGALP